MAITTYAELQSSIAAWLFDRGDLTATIPDFIRLAETQMERRLRAYQMVERKTATVDSRYTELPVDMLEITRVHLDGEHEPLQIRTPQELAEMRAVTNNTGGVPRNMAIVGNTIEVFPTPNDAFTGELMYYRTIPALADDNTSNWILTSYPDAYLYGALVHAGTFLRDDELVQTSSPLFIAAVDNINGNTERHRFPGPIRMKIK